MHKLETRKGELSVRIRCARTTAQRVDLKQIEQKVKRTEVSRQENPLLPNLFARHEVRVEKQEHRRRRVRMYREQQVQL